MGNKTATVPTEALNSTSTVKKQAKRSNLTKALTTILKGELLREVDRVYTIAEEGLDFTPVRYRVNFNLKGGRAGLANHSKRELGFNIRMYYMNRTEYLYVIPHEIAHHIALAKYWTTQGHNDRWVAIDESLGGIGKARHRMVVPNREVYECVGCGALHMLTNHSHLSVQKHSSNVTCNCDHKIEHIGSSNAYAETRNNC